MRASHSVVDDRVEMDDDFTWVCRKYKVQQQWQWQKDTRGWLVGAMNVDVRIDDWLIDDTQYKMEY
jgi:hypothetical protein